MSVHTGRPEIIDMSFGSRGRWKALRDNRGQQPPLAPADGTERQQRVRAPGGTVARWSKVFLVTIRGSPQ